jgi:hypothetical protein
MIYLLKKINWKVFAILLVAGLLGVVAILPYMVDLLGSRIMRDVPPCEIPLVLVVLLAIPTRFSLFNSGRSYMFIAAKQKCVWRS